MACEYSPSVADAIEQRWAGYDYNRADVIDMVARISRPGRIPSGLPISTDERVSAEALLAAGCE